MACVMQVADDGASHRLVPGYRIYLILHGNRGLCCVEGLAVLIAVTLDKHGVVKRSLKQGRQLWPQISRRVCLVMCSLCR